MNEAEAIARVFGESPESLMDPRPQIRPEVAAAVRNVLQLLTEVRAALVELVKVQGDLGDGITSDERRLIADVWSNYESRAAFREVEGSDMAIGSVKKRTITWTTKAGEIRTSVKWEARYRVPDGRQPGKSYPTKREAEEWLKRETASLVRGDWVDPINAKTTLRKYASDWQAIQVSLDGTARITDNALRLHILPRLGDHRLGTIKRSDVQAFVKHLEGKAVKQATETEPARTMAPGNVRNIYDVLARVLDAAVEDRVIPASPCKRITLPKNHDDEVDIPTAEEVEKVRAALLNLGGEGEGGAVAGDPACARWVWPSDR